MCYPGVSFRFPSVSVVSPSVFVRFRIPVYSGSHPVSGCSHPDPVFGEKMRQRKWVRDFPVCFRLFSSFSHGRRRQEQPLQVEVLRHRAAQSSRSTRKSQGVVSPIITASASGVAEQGTGEPRSLCVYTHLARDTPKMSAKASAPTAMGRSVHPLAASEARRSVAAAIPWR